jgi:hypothetical protein
MAGADAPALYWSKDVEEADWAGAVAASGSRPAWRR